VNPLTASSIDSAAGRIHRECGRTHFACPFPILRFLTRRFFCDNADCGQKIFAEQLPSLAARRARATPRFDRTLVEIGLECGGEPGRRLASRMGITTSGDTILRRLRTMPRAGFIESAEVPQIRPPMGALIGVQNRPL